MEYMNYPHALLTVVVTLLHTFCSNSNNYIALTFVLGKSAVIIKSFRACTISLQ